MRTTNVGWVWNDQLLKTTFNCSSSSRSENIFQHGTSRTSCLCWGKCWTLWRWLPLELSVATGGSRWVHWVQLTASNLSSSGNWGNHQTPGESGRWAWGRWLYERGRNHWFYLVRGIKSINSNSFSTFAWFQVSKDDSDTTLIDNSSENFASTTYNFDDWGKF